MGYSTQYTLAVVPAANPRAMDRSYGDEAIAALRAKYESAEYALEEDGSTAQECKWYDHKEDVQDISRQFPDALFVLQGYGEESTDIWIMYVLNGNVFKQPAKLVYAPYVEALKAWGMPADGSGFAPEPEVRRSAREYVHREQHTLTGPASPTITGQCHQ